MSFKMIKSNKSTSLSKTYCFSRTCGIMKGFVPPNLGARPSLVAVPVLKSSEEKLEFPEDCARKSKPWGRVWTEFSKSPSGMKRSASAQPPPPVSFSVAKESWLLLAERLWCLSTSGIPMRSWTEKEFPMETVWPPRSGTEEGESSIRGSISIPISGLICLLQEASSLALGRFLALGAKSCGDLFKYEGGKWSEEGLDWDWVDALFTRPEWGSWNRADAGGGGGGGGLASLGKCTPPGFAMKTGGQSVVGVASGWSGEGLNGEAELSLSSTEGDPDELFTLKLNSLGAKMRWKPWGKLELLIWLNCDGEERSLVKAGLG